MRGKWTDINKEWAYKRTVLCTNNTELRTLGKFLHNSKVSKKNKITYVVIEVEDVAEVL